MTTIKRLAMILVLTVILGSQAYAWGPMTHLTVNLRAYRAALETMRTTLVIPPDLAGAFIGGGPSPDIKMSGGADFPQAFHNSLETVVRMVDLAKKDARFGMVDVVEALGWCGHLFAEVTTAHAPDGYPNNKMTFSVPGGSGINHQVNELAVDILNYAEYADDLKGKAISMPMRLLEAAMKNEQTTDSSLKAMNAGQIKAVTNNFLVSVWGIKTVAEYIKKNRPELIEEMRDFHSDRVEALQASIDCVVKFLQDHAKKDFTKSVMESADGRDKVKLPVSGDLMAKIKAYGLNVFSAISKSEKAGDIFTGLGGGLLKFATGTDLTRDQLRKVAASVGGGAIWGDPRHKEIVERYVEGILLRQDLTYTEIVAYAQGSFEADSQNLVKRRQQFSAKGLSEDGRRKPTVNEVMVAVKEVERIEAVRSSWPVFWPWRPSDVDLALAREKASRLAAFFIIDHYPTGTPLVKRANTLLDSGRQVRAQAWGYRWESLLHPIKKWNAYKETGKLSETLGGEERFFSQFLVMTAQSGSGEMNAAKVRELINQAKDTLEKKEAILSTLREDVKKISLWTPIKREKAKAELTRVETEVAQMKENIANLESIEQTLAGGTVAVLLDDPAGTTEGGNEGAAVPREVQLKYEKAYRDYVAVLGRKSADDPEVATALEKLREAEGLRKASLEGK